MEKYATVSTISSLGSVETIYDDRESALNDPFVKIHKVSYIFKIPQSVIDIYGSNLQNFHYTDDENSQNKINDAGDFVINPDEDTEILGGTLLQFSSLNEAKENKKILSDQNILTNSTFETNITDTLELSKYLHENLTVLNALSIHHNNTGLLLNHSFKHVDGKIYFFETIEAIHATIESMLLHQQATKQTSWENHRLANEATTQLEVYQMQLINTVDPIVKLYIEDVEAV